MTKPVVINIVKHYKMLQTGESPPQYLVGKKSYQFLSDSINSFDMCHFQHIFQDTAQICIYFFQCFLIFFFYYTQPK